MPSSTIGKDVKIEGRSVKLEVGPNDQVERSNYFHLGIWTWQVSVILVHEGNKHTWLTTLWPCSSLWDDYVASVSFKFRRLRANQLVRVDNIPEVEVSLDHPHTWEVIDEYDSTRCLVEIKIVNVRMVSKTMSILLSSPMKAKSKEHAGTVVPRMLREGFLTDITVNAVGGSNRAHRAVLAARSPVFLSMFSHDLREKELSTVDMSDMSIATCRAFVRYLYGDASEKELVAHRSELLSAGDKYDVAKLKKLCELSMTEDVNTKNLLERLQLAHIYSLPSLKTTCVRLLVDHGKMYEIPEDFEEFVKSGDQELVDEIKQIAVSRGRKFPITTGTVTASTSSSPSLPPTAVSSSASKRKSDSPALLRRSTRLKKLKSTNG